MVAPQPLRLSGFGLFALALIIAPSALVAPYPPTFADPLQLVSPMAHPSTDENGIDVLSRLIAASH
jgi:hypothetical protein